MLALRPMTLLEIIDASFRIYRNNFWLLFGVAAIAFVPLQVISNALQFMGQSSEGLALLGALTLPLAAVASLLGGAAMTKAAVSRYLNEPETVGGAWVFILKKCVAYTLTIVVAGFLVIAGVVLLIVPGIIFAFWCYFVNQVFVVEGLRSAQAIRRSRQLMAGYWAKAFAVGIVGSMAAWIILMLFAVPSGIVLAVSKQPAGIMGAVGAIFGILEGVGNAFVQPIPLLMGILLYFDSRIRKEGFDIEMLARQLGSTIQPPQPPQPPQPTEPAQPPA